MCLNIYGLTLKEEMVLHQKHFWEVRDLQELMLKKNENLNVSQVMMGSPNHPQDPIILLWIMWFFNWWGMNQVITQRGASFMISLVDGIFEKGETLKLELK